MADKTPRDRVVSIRFTEEERAALEAHASLIGVGMSEMVRRAALSVLFPAPPVPSSATHTSSAPLARIDFGGQP